MEKRRCCGCMNLTDEPVCPICGTDRSYTNQFHQLPVGTMLRDQYLVGKVLGQGGFGITYIGWDTYLDIPVAIKEFYPGNTVNRDCAQSCSVRIHAPDLEAPFEASKERFLREAKALAKLRHVPQIVGIQSFFKENGTAYIVMEFIKGTDLRHYVSMRGGKLGAGETFRILEPIFHALSTVHQAGLVHRDISPDNIMLDPMGGAKLLDFGAARDVESADADVDLARSTEAILKQGFAPMEQYRSRGGLGPWTDEYGLCATIYYCLTGKVPPDAIARSMDEAQLDWDSIPDLEPHQKAALEQGMAMRAKDRFGSMEELRRAIYTNREAPSDAAQPKPAPAKPAPVKKEPVPAPKSFSTGKKRGKFVVLGIVAVLVLVAAIALPGMFSREQPELPEEPVIATQESAPEQTTQPDIPEQGTTEPVTEPVTEPAPQPWEENVLMYMPFENVNGLDNVAVTSVTFLDSLDEAPSHAVDASANQNGSVVAWWKNNGEVYFAAEGGINGRDSAQSLFQACYNLVTVEFGGAYHTEQAVSMAHMFEGCIALEQVDVQNLATGNVQDFSYMFYLSHRIFDNVLWNHNEVLRTLDVGSWDTSCATNMKYMFTGCQGLESLDVSRWDTSNVTDMTDMFYMCHQLSALDVSDWNVSKVQYMTSLFAACSGLTELDVSRWDVSAVVCMDGMFHGCSDITQLDVGDWDVSGVESMSDVFFACTSLKTLDLARWNVSRVTNMTRLFSQSYSLESLDVSSWDVGNVTNMLGMFNGCLALKDLDVSGWDTSSSYNVSEMFYNCWELEAPDVSRWDTSKITEYTRFYYQDRGQNWQLLFG